MEIGRFAVSRCFDSVKSLKLFDPDVLCEAMRHFPDDLERGGVALPESPGLENISYEAIQKMLVTGDASDGLTDLLFYVERLGNAEGWEHVVREAKLLGLRVEERAGKRSYAGCVLQAWLSDWPRNSDLLEKSYARTRLYSLTAYRYFPMGQDLRGKYRSPGDEDIRKLESELERHFDGRGHGKWVRVHRYEFEDEIWFMIRHSGRYEYVQTADDKGEEVRKYRPVKFDAVTYSKKNGFLRMNTERRAEQSKYRAAIGHLLFGEANVFVEDRQCVTLEPLKGASAGIFDCGDMRGIRDVELVEVHFLELASPGRTVTWKQDGRDGVALSRAAYVQLEDGVRVAYENHVLPPSTGHVMSAKFRYTLRNSRGRRETLTVHAGNRLRYARDSDAARIGEWLIERGFVRVGWRSAVVR